MQRVENYVTLEFLSRSSNEGFARLPALRHSWIPHWTSWEISRPPSAKRSPTPSSTDIRISWAKSR